MPILRCDNCGCCFVYGGKSLTVRCPNECGPGYWDETLNVDQSTIRRNGHELDGRYYGAMESGVEINA